jgi:hypothetical protein
MSLRDRTRREHALTEVFGEDSERGVANAAREVLDVYEAATPDRKPLVYVAGPYTNPDPILNTNRAIKAGMELWETGLCAILIPHLSLLAHMVEPRDLDYWYELDIDQLAHCDVLYRLPGTSTGADKEVAFAEAREIPVFHERDLLQGWLEERR